MRATTATKLSLAEWFSIMGIHPLHAAGVNLQALTEVEGNCAGAWMQHEWQQHDAVSREELSRFIARAEADIEEALGFSLMPSWEVDERQVSIRPVQPETINLGGSDVRWYRQPIITDKKWFLAGGIRGTTVVLAAAPITWAVVPAGEYPRTGSVSAPYTGSDACEIQVFYPGKGADPTYQIRPAKVVIAAGVATVTFARELTVLEELQEELLAGPVDGLDNASFLTTVDIYRVYNDPSTQVSFLWEPVGGCGCDSITGGCPSCSYATSTGCLVPRDGRLGIVNYGPASWDAATSAYIAASFGMARQPDILRLYYLAGLEDTKLACPRTTMSADWARTVAYYAASMVDREWCACSANIAEQWQVDLSHVSGGEEFSRYALSPANLNNPFGPRRGAVYAWQRVNGRDSRIGRAAVIAR